MQALALYNGPLWNDYSAWISIGHLYEAASEIAGVSAKIHNDIVCRIAPRDNMGAARIALSQASILVKESFMGYPSHVWVAIGHMANASDVLLASHYDWANQIRAERLNLIEDHQYVVPFEHLLDGPEGLLAPEPVKFDNVMDILDEVTILKNEADDGDCCPDHVRSAVRLNICVTCDFYDASDNTCTLDKHDVAFKAGGGLCPMGAWPE